MPSDAYTNHLIPLLADADELIAGHRQLRTGNVGRQWRLGAINRAVVVVSLSAWEAYVEQLAIEAVNAIQPAGNNVTIWQSVNATTRAQIGRFNTPNVENVRRLFADSIGLQDVTQNWTWQNITVAQARTRLTDAITFRHQVAHGVNPRPTIHNQYSQRLPAFFRLLSRNTDSAVRDYLVNTLAVANPWPA